MCGVPFHAYEGYLARLIRKGFHVAICEQTESPEEAKKRGYRALVAREVVRIVTPGTVTEEQLLDSRASNYLACITRVSNQMAIAWIDLATAAPLCEAIHESMLDATLTRLAPREILMADQLATDPALEDLLTSWRGMITPQPQSRFDSQNAKTRLLEIYGISDLSSFGDFPRACVTALGSLLDYITITQKCDTSHIRPPQQIKDTPYMLIDAATQRNLEILSTQNGTRQGSVLDIIDMTCTGAGARLLAARLSAPLIDLRRINQRLDAVSYILENAALRENLRKTLGSTPDLQRALARLSLKRGGPRDLGAVRDALYSCQRLRGLLLAQDPQTLPRALHSYLEDLGDYAYLQDLLARALRDELPLLARDGHFIAPGYAPRLDEQITLHEESCRLIEALNKKYIHKTGINTLKIKHNMVIGYFIEVSPANGDKLMAQPTLFIHRQSLAGVIRFTTLELNKLSHEISQAGDRALAIEQEIFEELSNQVLASLEGLRLAAQAMAALDVTASLAHLAKSRQYARPVLDGSRAFKITQGRHPVVEQALKRKAYATPFVSNDCDLSQDQRLWLLTGPNMAGKSTFLRQNALIAILAQMGSFVPAQSAHIGLVDRLFSRVGAADDLARGQSTFMVEMVETAAILHQASPQSLVILDEIGRGTATFDGLSIAWATVEHIHNQNKCRTLFATHYHELTQLSAKLSNMTCATMKIKEWDKEIVFLHEVVAGTANRSYGIHVAQMAGLPPSVITRAQAILKHLESEKTKDKPLEIGRDLPLFAPIQQASMPQQDDSPLQEALYALNPDDLTPKEALEALYKLKDLTEIHKKKKMIR